MDKQNPEAVNATNATNATEETVLEDAKKGAEKAAESQESIELTPAQEIAALKDKLAEAADRMLRQHAEFQNYKRRADEQRRTAMQFGREEVLNGMIGILDDLGRSVEATESVESPAAGFESLREGVSMVFKKFTDEMTRLKVEEMNAVGKPFNENEHEAMMQQPAPDGTEPGTVLMEIQKGYKIGDRVLRHAKVIVAAE